MKLTLLLLSSVVTACGPGGGSFAATVAGTHNGKPVNASTSGTPGALEGPAPESAFYRVTLPSHGGQPNAFGFPELVLNGDAPALGTVSFRGSTAVFESVATVHSGTITLDISKLVITGNPNAPFGLKGTFQGSLTQSSSQDTLQVTGGSLEVYPDCSKKAAGSSVRLCGAMPPASAFDAQLGSRGGAGDCSAAVKGLFMNGSTLHWDGKSTVKIGSARTIECLNNKDTSRVVCVSQVEDFSADGCKWTVAAMAFPDSNQHIGFELSAVPSAGCTSGGACLMTYGL